VQDSPRNRKPGEEAAAGDAPSASTRRRQWQDVLNEQLRALYETYRADDIPPDLLDLAARIEEAQQKSRSGGGGSGGEGEPSHNGSREDKAQQRDSNDTK
jgi:hypothetical protein